MTTEHDIDVDFAADRREEVIQDIYERYGEEHVGMVCNVVTYRARSAVRASRKRGSGPPGGAVRPARGAGESPSQESSGLVMMLDGWPMPSTRIVQQSGRPSTTTRGGPRTRTPRRPRRCTGRSWPVSPTTA